MFFRNKKTSDQRRIRQPSLGGGTSSKPVFSYHARSAQTDKSSGRKASFMWLADKPAKARPKPKRWPRRASVVVGAVLLLALVAANLLVSRDPEIVTLADTGQRQVFLRSQDTYYQAARDILGSSLANSNKLTIDSTRIAKAMQDQFAELEDVSVTLPIVGRKPTIYIQPARPALLIKTPAGELFIVDTTGRALMSASQAPKLDKLGLGVVEDQSGLKIELGHGVLPSGNIDFITEVLGQLKAKSIKVTALILPKSANELDVKVEGQPYTVKFNLRGNAREEAGAFLAVKQYVERSGKVPGSYIDVRVPNKAYYR